nr:MAG TPA: protein of unknown function (DUF4083) [Caudoviricetes sp.]
MFTILIILILLFSNLIFIGYSNNLKSSLNEKEQKIRKYERILYHKITNEDIGGYVCE